MGFFTQTTLPSHFMGARVRTPNQKLASVHQNMCVKKTCERGISCYGVELYRCLKREKPSDLWVGAEVGQQHRKKDQTIQHSQNCQDGQHSKEIPATNQHSLLLRQATWARHFINHHTPTPQKIGSKESQPLTFSGHFGRSFEQLNQWNISSIT